MPNTMSVEAATAILRTIPLSAFLVEAFFSGIYTCLALLTVWAILFEAKPSPRNKFWLAIVVFMYTSATTHAGLTWGLFIHAIAYHGATPGVVGALTASPVWFKAVGATMFAVNILIADCLFIWRCWGVWGYRWSIVAAPILATIGGTAMACISIVGQVSLTQNRTSPNVASQLVKFTVPYFALSLATSLTTTFLIAARIMHVQKSAPIRSLQGRYYKIIEIIVESAALYSFSLLLFVVFVALKNINTTFMQDIQSQVSGIAPTLIILRVALGHTKDDRDPSWMSSVTASGLQFGGHADIEMSGHSQRLAFPDSTMTLAASNASSRGQKN